jgi:hypothetical protein
MTTVRELLESGSCTPACIAAVTTSERCKCPCRDRFHGLCADANIDALLDARGRGMNLLTDLEILCG